eukprot:CAMPEP_0119356006 /NCGR_PEP_ID=MMETSP1334-20130426/4750_1 /TAXON_ID=127549 /ORGANISM="Calcidiscus leptoporus, Strain RCC1130" /LENGTH=287 /DNA_ID=CAMNT_0007369965 /DNA_START=36 /DNA_END=899 /DNA_ORIENTATION=-
MADLLQKRAQRVQVAAKLGTLEKELDGAQAHKLSRVQHSKCRELRKLLADIDSFIRLNEIGSSARPVEPEMTTKRAERGRIKAEMRRWDAAFERAHRRKPRAVDREADPSFTELSQLLRLHEASHALPSPRCSSDDVSVPAERGAAGVVGLGDAGRNSPGFAHRYPGASGTVEPWPALGELVAPWDSYYELAISQVSSQAVANGVQSCRKEHFEMAVALFSQYDVDRDGVIGRIDWQQVTAALADRAGRSLDEQTDGRLFTLADIDGNGVIDLNEFLLLRHKTSERA